MNASLRLAFKLRDGDLRRRIDDYLRKAPGGRRLALREDGPQPSLPAHDGRVWRVLLSSDGDLWSSDNAAAQWRRREADGLAAAEFLVGGPDGWPGDCAPDDRWAFGRVTLPHALAALVAAEQLYRIATILVGHPYHLGHAG